MWRKVLFKIVTSNLFEAFIMICILINMLIFMMKTAESSEKDHVPIIDIKLKDVNLIFLIIFCMEAFLKILCMGKNYFYDDYNKFDFFIVSLTLISNIVEVIGFNFIGTEASILRIFRLGRLLRLVSRASYFRMIFTTFIFASIITITIIIFIAANIRFQLFFNL